MNVKKENICEFLGHLSGVLVRDSVLLGFDAMLIVKVLTYEFGFTSAQLEKKNNSMG
jgi:hypothetical protein